MDARLLMSLPVVIEKKIYDCYRALTIICY